MRGAGQSSLGFSQWWCRPCRRVDVEEVETADGAPVSNGCEWYQSCVLPHKQDLAPAVTYVDAGAEDENPTKKKLLHQMRRSRLQTLSVKKQLNYIAMAQAYSAPSDDLRWFEFALHGLWPFVVEYARNFVLHELASTIRQCCKGVPLMKNFKFLTCQLGDEKPKLEQVNCKRNHDAVEFIFYVRWKAHDAKIEVEVGNGIKAGVKDFQFQGVLHLTLSPLSHDLPLVQGLSVCFYDPPDLTWTWTGAVKALQALEFMQIRDGIVRALFSTIVVPSRIFVDFRDHSDENAALFSTVNHSCAPPVGVLYVEVVRACNLPARDFFGKSDPYVVVQIGGHSFKTRTMPRTVDPVWGNFHGDSFIIHALEQHVCIDLWDHDRVSFDDSLGYATVEEEGGDAETDDIKPRIRRPSVAELVEKQDVWWPIQMRDKKYSDRNKAKQPLINLRCRFTPVDVDLALRDVTPHVITCPTCSGSFCDIDNHNGHASKCGFCGHGLSRGMLSSLGAKLHLVGNHKNNEQATGGMVCASCKYGVCKSCYIQRRPACALLQIVLESARVPAEEANQGVMTSCQVGDTVLRSNASQLPFERWHQGVSKEKAVNNLHWHAGLDLETIGRCLGIALDEVEHLIDKTQTMDARPSLPASHMNRHTQTQTVVWGQAFYFTVKDPTFQEGEDHQSFTLRYIVPSEKGRKGAERHLESEVPLFSTVRPPHERLEWRVGDATDNVKISLEVNLVPLAPCA